MIIEYDLKGFLMRHKGVFETTGFWVKYGEDIDPIEKFPTLYKLWSHCSFTYETDDPNICEAVWAGIIRLLRNKTEFRMEGIGFIRNIG